MLKRTISFMLKCAGLIAVTSILGTLWLTVSFLCPVNEENARKSYDIISEEGAYPDMLSPEAEYDIHENFHSFLPGILDNHTDAIMLYTATRREIGNPLKSAMEMYSDYLGDSYERYWHGYMGILRPLLLLTDYAKIRVLNVIIQLLLVLVFAYRIWRRTHKAGYLLMLFTSYLLLMPPALGKSLQFTWVFYIALGPALFLIRKKETLSSQRQYLYVFLIVGSLTCFFDLLTYPLFTWAFPCVWFLVLSEEQLSRIDRVKQVISTGICWILGYAGMWASKWLISGMVLRQNVTAAAMQQAAIRSGADTFSAGERLQTLYLNWRHYSYLLFAILLCLWTCFFLYTTFRYGVGGSPKLPALFLIICSGLVWYTVMADHTFTHHFFTYRIYNGCLIAFMALVLECRYSAKAGTLPEKRGYLLVGWLVVAVASCGLALTAREEVFAMNGECSFREIELKSGQSITAKFVPTFSEIKEIGFGVRNLGTTGECVISVYSGDRKRQEKHISLSNYGENVYYSFPVKWKLKHGKSYTLEMHMDSRDGEISLLVTENGELPLIEYSEMTIDGTAVGGEFLSGITYRCLPIDKKVLMLYALAWFQVLGAAAVSAYSVYRSAKKKMVTFRE